MMRSFSRERPPCFLTPSRHLAVQAIQLDQRRF
jgi:hypothetical protein